MHFWREKVALITGGSAGFGLELARTMLAAGAHVIITGREATRLEQAVATLRATAPHIAGEVCDARDDAQVIAMMDRVVQRHGRLDALVNNIGQSTRGLAAETTPGRYQELWETNFLTAVRATRAALPALLQSRGHLIFMGSLASKSAARFLGAYPPTKFAVAAYAQQLRLELRDQGLHVLLVCPGPIARRDANVRYSDQTAGLPSEARRPGGGVQLRGVPPAELAERMLRACERRDAELIVPSSARWLFALAQLWPRLGDWILLKKTAQRAPATSDEPA